ncbi:MAG: N-acetyl-gamma-glutamyl-phosphate reductase [Proteobacteria bacterium]|nr:N-acetyl-gamma-glutamyl-phosphate reductase [Pseudomonadota bacterium]
MFTKRLIYQETTVHTIFIDGQVGTTGLQIADRLKKRGDIALLEIPQERRKNRATKKEYLNSADLVVLCLPDAAARESVEMIENDRVKVLDASTAHRTDPNWAYGLPELSSEQRGKIRSASRVSNPGCYPTGFLVGIAPLVRSGIVPPDFPVTINAVSGYSGGGRQMIEAYQNREKSHPDQLWTYRPYGFQLAHKHVPEMHKYSGLIEPPLFVPSVAHFQQGMMVSIPLVGRLLKKGWSSEEVHAVLNESYQGEEFVNLHPLNDFDNLQDGFLSALECNETNRIDLLVFGNRNQILIAARLDNLGKGASGAAVQNMNIMLGEKENKGI